MKKTIILVVAVSAIALLPLIASAQCASTNGFVPLACPTGSALQTVYNSPDLPSYFNALFKIAISVGAIIAVLQIVRAGYLYMLKDSFSIKQNAKEIFSDAIIGLLLLLSMWIILDVINPCILNLNILQDFTTSSVASRSCANPPS